ncbi:response regulator [Psychrobium sp. 1_MG-2023]|uniref:response regulator n=1 Tax=Psychrobium sp. 1_MG-2023 TaxID=3062624 RepID=UPI000C31C84E|nr:response regulator [Psychrobium sp. 1_MG-2023]MDP2562266.1 response regulator [Psychrobium sp. 1_MG-2023]PKF57516.1 response regulator [Alteromonadales bacterium alter-6D02]
MTIPILICDDSSFARKQMARALPPNWDVSISFAEHGEEAIEAIKAGKGDILFLDLNMPVLDGYGTLEVIQAQDLPTLTIVVSGDIQPEAHKRVKSLGALDFIKKPTDKQKVKDLLTSYGILREEDLVASELLNENETFVEEDDSDKIRVSDNNEIQLDPYQEVANVAMGRAGDLLARVLNVTVTLPIPKVNVLASSELHMMLKATDETSSISAVCQGYIGSGISGEALILFYDSAFDDLAKLMEYEGELTESAQREMLVDLSNILIGAFLKGFSDQLDLSFSQSHPELLGLHRNINDLIYSDTRNWQDILAIEINYSIEEYNLECDLIVLITQDSLPILNNKLIYLLDEQNA